MTLNVSKMELKMDLVRCIIAAGLLVFSGQSLALFMPDGFTISTESTVASDEGCGVIVAKSTKLQW